MIPVRRAGRASAMAIVTTIGGAVVIDNETGSGNLVTWNGGIQTVSVSECIEHPFDIVIYSILINICMFAFLSMK